MDFNSSRLEAPSRIREYTPKYSEEERARRAARRKSSLPADEQAPDTAGEDEVHELDDLV